jgi:glutamate racemase
MTASGPPAPLSAPCPDTAVGHDVPERTAFAGLRIGVFDSGLGGLSMLAPIQAQLPGAALVYAADSRYAPYGERSDEYVLERSRALTEFLLRQGARMIVVACNTATAAAIHDLRQRWRDVPFIGVEPGVKPALTQSPTGRVGVLATPMTLRSEKFQHLLAAQDHREGVVLQACPGLAAEIERGALDSPRLRELVAEFVAPLVAARVDTVVLGCTHYPLIAPLFQDALPASVRLIDTAPAVARHARRLADVLLQNGIPKATPPAAEAEGGVDLWSTLDAEHLARVAHQWLGLPETARLLPST